jgi:plastocyanin
MSRCITPLSFVLAVGLVVGCSGAPDSAPPATPGSAPPAGAAASAVKPTGRVITIELITDEKGNYFKPAKFEAHRGDVLRFVAAREKMRNLRGDDARLAAARAGEHEQRHVGAPHREGLRGIERERHRLESAAS